MPRWPKKEEAEEKIEVEQPIQQVTQQPIKQQSEELIDELAPVEGESPEHKRVREVYLGYRLKQPKDWKFHKKSLLEQLEKL